jgi:hypothetical protein
VRVLVHEEQANLPLLSLSSSSFLPAGANASAAMKLDYGFALATGGLDLPVDGRYGALPSLATN